MSEEDKLKKKALNMFTGNREEILKNELERMEGWFDISDSGIILSGEIQELDKGRKYLSYLLAAYISNFIEKRDSPFVTHQKIDEFFGWEDERGATEYVCDYSDLLNREHGKASIKISRMKEIVDKIEGELEDKDD